MPPGLTAAWHKRRDMLVHSVVPLNAEPPGWVLAGDEITAADAFYCRNHGVVPELAPERWQLTVNGTTTLSYTDLTTGFPAHDVVATLECAGNRRAELLRVRPIPGKEPWGCAAISTAVWRGARLADVLDAAGGLPSADAHAAFTGADTTSTGPYGGSIPLDKALSEEVLLTWAMNGEPLPRLHGGPVRVVVPGFIGARSVKWLTGIRVQAQPSQNHFQAVDYRLHGVALSTLRLSCAILTPDDGASVPPGPLTVRGYAIGPDCRRIAAVEISLDDETTWQTATLKPPLGPWAWRHWSCTAVVEPGPLRITARAIDDAGATHPESPATLWNPSGYANNAWSRVQLSVQPRR